MSCYEALAGAYDALTEDVGYAQRADFLEKLQGAIREACAFPESGAPVDNAFLPNGTVRKKLVGSYLLYYFPDREDERIYILRVLYGRRNLDELLREMDLN